MDLKSVAVVVFQSKGLTGGGKVSEREGVREREGQRKGRAKGGLETVLFFY